MSTNPRNSAYTKAYNRKLIIRHIYKQPLSRAQLARETGLTRAAVTNIIDEIIKDGIIYEKESVSNGVGRTPILLDIVSDSFFILGVNISRQGCTIGLTNLKGKVITKKDINIEEIYDTDSITDKIKKELNHIVYKTRIDKSKILGVGICTPGPVDIHTGRILNPPNFDIWHNAYITAKFKNDLTSNVKLENYSSGLALAEKIFGLGKSKDSFILINVDSGIGSGVVINKKLYKGTGGFGAEIGHTTINSLGKQCACGNYDCLELYASIPEILKEATNNRCVAVSWLEIVEMAENGDEKCIHIIDKEAFLLSSGIVNAVNILEIEDVVLTGDIYTESKLLFDRIRYYVGMRTMTRRINFTTIYVSGILKDVEIVSAVSVIIDEFLCSI